MHFMLLEVVLLFIAGISHVLGNNNKGIFVYYTSRLTQLYYLIYYYIGLTTTCFGPACGPSSGCNFDSRSSYTMCGVIIC